MKIIIDAEATLSGKLIYLSMSRWTDNSNSSIVLGTRFNVILTASSNPENEFEKFSVKLPYEYEKCQELAILKGSVIAFEGLTGTVYSQSKARPSWEATNIILGEDFDV